MSRLYRSLSTDCSGADPADVMRNSTLAQTRPEAPKGPSPVGVAYPATPAQPGEPEQHPRPRSRHVVEARDVQLRLAVADDLHQKRALDRRAVGGRELTDQDLAVAGERVDGIEGVALRVGRGYCPGATITLVQFSLEILKTEVTVTLLTSKSPSPEFVTVTV